jgi:predicted transcriptional regulator
MPTHEGGYIMNKILSARIDDAVFRTITDLSQKMRSSKKAVIEKAIILLLRL